MTEVRFQRFAAGVNGVERRGKILRYVARGEVFENVGVQPGRPSEKAQKIVFLKSM